MLITFEGLDTSGKSTQAGLLVGRLRASKEHPTVHFIREPGGTDISERIREILLDRSHSRLCREAELFLFSASRAQLVADVIRPALKRDEIVVCDRYYDSTTAYQGYGRGLDLQSIASINLLASLGIVPDLTILLDLSIEEIGRRRASAGLSNDRMESSGESFYRRVRDGYLAMAQQETKRFVVIDAREAIGEVGERVWETVQARLAQ